MVDKIQMQVTLEVIQDLQVELNNRLQAKTSWGRNEITVLYLEAVNTVLSRRLLGIASDTVES